VVRRSIAHPKQVPLEVRMDMADFSCSGDSGSHNLFQASTEKSARIVNIAYSLKRRTFQIHKQFKQKK